MVSPKKILLTDKPHPYLLKRLQGLGLECLHHYQTSAEDLLPVLEDCYGLVVRSRLQIDRRLLDAAPQLAFIARYGVGTEHIDLEYAAEREIKVFTSPEGSRDTVAEHTLGLLLMLMNNLARADRQVKAGQWIREPNRGVEIKGKTVGILGYGNMGQATARRLQGFDARVIAYDKFKADYGDAFAEEVSLAQLQDEADILSIHIPFLPENYHFVNKEFLQGFRKKLFIVNTARGTVLNTADLVTLLQSNKVLGAALDVIEYEEMSFDQLDPAGLPEPFQYLIQADNVVLNPHIAGWSVESKLGHARVLAQKIEDYLQSKEV